MIGIDIVRIERFTDIQQSEFASRGRGFTKTEWDYAFRKGHPAESLAGIFAAKEAVMKSNPSKLAGWFDRIEIAHAETGEPLVHIDGSRSSSFHISIAHEGALAVAVAVDVSSLASA